MAARSRDGFGRDPLARAKASSFQAPSNPLSNPEAFRQFQTTQDQLSSALARLLVTVERYPDLKASQSLLTLQSQLGGTENRIAIARKDYIEAVRQYNTEMKTIPGRWWHSLPYPEYEPMTNCSAPEATQAPAPHVEL